MNKTAILIFKFYTHKGSTMSMHTLRTAIMLIGIMSASAFGMNFNSSLSQRTFNVVSGISSAFFSGVVFFVLEEVTTSSFLTPPILPSHRLAATFSSVLYKTVLSTGLTSCAVGFLGGWVRSNYQSYTQRVMYGADTVTYALCNGMDSGWLLGTLVYCIGLKNFIRPAVLSHLIG